ncbi:hypothetical protein EDC04DRAFT_2669627 [Pisolithus marmoratus]|nr:hypothetical protein EDC04DRAFT_2669627 [Pisolithus marmoratus]
MPFRLPFSLGSSTRRERTSRSGGSWWRRSRSSVATAPTDAHQPVSPSPGRSQPRTQAQVTTSSPSSSYSTPNSRADSLQELTFNAASSSQVACDGDNRNSGGTPRGDGQHVLGAGLAQHPSPSLPSTTHTPGMSETLNSTPSFPVDAVPHPPTEGDSPPSSLPTGAGAGTRSNLIIPIIVIGLQPPTTGWESPHPAHFHDPLHHHHQHYHGRIRSIDDEDDTLELDGFPDAFSVPDPLSSALGNHLSPGPPTNQQNVSSQESSPQDGFLPAQAQQSPQPRTWQNRAFDMFRNLIRARQNSAASTGAVTGETLASQTLLIYVIGGFSSNDHHIIMGGNLDSFEALWELAEFLGQVKPPTASREDIERSGLEVIQSSSLEEYEKTERISSNCVERCLICLEDYTPEEHIRVLTCKHAFHQACVDRWLETGRNNCPACRSKGVENTSSGSSTTTETSASTSRST